MTPDSSKRDQDSSSSSSSAPLAARLVERLDYLRATIAYDDANTPHNDSWPICGKGDVKLLIAEIDRLQSARLVDAFPVNEGDYKVADIQADDLLEKALGALADIATADDMKHPPLMRNKARRIYYEIREELTLRAARLVDPPREEMHEEDHTRVGRQSGLTASLPQPPTGDE